MLSPCLIDWHLQAKPSAAHAARPAAPEPAAVPPQDRLEKKSFFNWFYFAINWGSCLAVTVVVYVQDSISWAIGFAIPTVAMAIAIITFTAGSSLYTHVEPTERSVLPRLQGF